MRSIHFDLRNHIYFCIQYYQLIFDSSKAENEEQKSDENKGFYSKLKFAFKAMDKSIRWLATNGRFLAIGGYDETIKLFNINK